jgi:hypothetical protein
MGNVQSKLRKARLAAAQAQKQAAKRARHASKDAQNQGRPSRPGVETDPTPHSEEPRP